MYETGDTVRHDAGGHDPDRQAHGNGGIPRSRGCGEHGRGVNQESQHAAAVAAPRAANRSELDPVPQYATKKCEL